VLAVRDVAGQRLQRGVGSCEGHGQEQRRLLLLGHCSATQIKGKWEYW